MLTRAVAPKQWTDYWILGVPPLGLLHLGLFGTLQSRPGALGPILWKWGPSVLVLSAAGLLFVALGSAILSRTTWSLRRAVGLAGLLTIVGTTGVYRTYPSSYDSTPSDVEFHLPLDGDVTVAWGGRTAGVNYHVISPGERWGYDLLMTVEGRSFRTDGRSLKDYHAFGRPVRSPADGRVVHARDGVADGRPGDADRQGGAGNHIVLEVAPRQYLFVAHLRSGSVRPQTGQMVDARDIIGEVGNSGNSSEPHVHVHLQDSPYADSGEGIPLRFVDAWLKDTHPPMRRFMPEGGTRRGRYVGDVVFSGN
jgi:hypothetical protein